MRRGPTPGAVYELEADEITIGRGNKNTIVVRDNEVSREHCRLVRLSENYEVRDLDSSNGTFVNGQRVSSTWLLSRGELIELGDTITLEYGGKELDAQPAVESAPVAVELGSFYSFVMTKGPAVGYVYPLEDESITIGRDLDNDLVIQDPEVSRQHLRLHRSQRGYLIEDLRSTNGTFINGEPLLETRCLEPNDIVKLGTVIQLQYIYGDEPADEDTPTSRPPDLNLDKDITLASLKVDPTRRALSARSIGL